MPYGTSRARDRLRTARPVTAMQVVILGIEPERVLAHVAGTEDYRTELWGTANSRIDS